MPQLALLKSVYSSPFFGRRAMSDAQAMQAVQVSLLPHFGGVAPGGKKTCHLYLKGDPGENFLCNSQHARGIGIMFFCATLVKLSLWATPKTV